MPHLFLSDAEEDNTCQRKRHYKMIKMRVLSSDSVLHFMFSPTGIRCHMKMKTKKKIKTI